MAVHGQVGEIAEEFRHLDSMRHGHLEKARQVSANTIPSELPAEGQASDQHQFVSPWTSTPARAFLNYANALLLATYTPGMLWARYAVPREILYDPAVPAKDKAKLAQQLYRLSWEIEDAISRHGVAVRHNGVAFRNGKRRAYLASVLFGDSLHRIADDFTIRNIRLDNYVTVRDGCGNVMKHIYQEAIDPLSLSPEQFEASGLDRDKILKMKSWERLHLRYTLVEWKPMDKVWEWSEHVNGNRIDGGQEKVSRWISIPLHLPPECNYGRGLGEMYHGDIHAVNRLTKSVMDHAGLASKHHPIIDIDQSHLSHTALQQPNGAPIYDRINENGGPRSIGHYRIDRLPDFNVVDAALDRIERRLAAALLLESEVTPRGDRVTATQAARVGRELEVSRNGGLAPAEQYDMQPTLEFILSRLKTKLPTFRGQQIRAELLTGTAALARADLAERLASMVNAIQGIPDLVQGIDRQVLLAKMEEASFLDEPGLVRSIEDLEQIEARAQRMAGEQAGATAALQAALNQTNRPAQAGPATGAPA